MQQTFLEKHIRKIVFLLFFFSGVAGLIYEIVWIRRLLLVFGSTSFATSTVLASFMGGLALGSFVIGRWIDRRNDPLRIYGILILATGIYAVALPLLLHAVSPVYTIIYRTLGVNFPVLTAFRFLLCFLLLMVPTTLMGGTLPVLCKFMVRHPETVRINLGRLYSLNTFGAVLGCFMAGFFMLPYLGLIRTTLAAAGIDVLAGIAALLLHSQISSEAADQFHRVEERNLKAVARLSDIPPWLLKLVLVMFALSGFASLSYEILWTRLLVFFISNTIYAFSIMLTIFLLSIAVGSYIFQRFFRRARHLVGVFAIIELLIGITAVCSLPLLMELPHADRNIVGIQQASHFFRFSFNAMLKALIVMAAPTILIGIAFPLVNAIYSRNAQRIGGRVGSAYSINNIGAILGSVVAGFIIVPLIGTRLGLMSIAALNVAIGLSLFAALCFRHRRRAFVPVAAVSLATVIAFPVVLSRAIPRTAYARIFKVEEEGEVTFLKEGIGGTVTIEQFPAYRTISINGVNVAGTNKAFHTTQKLQAHLALLLHPDPKQVLQIGFGSGGTAYSASLHDLDHLDCVEISPVVLEAAPDFHETNRGLLDKDNPKLNVFIDDARSYILHTDKLYDVILSDSTHPTVAGNGALYTVDYFTLCYNRLKDDGIFSTWLPLYNLRAEDYKIILRSMREVFPHVYIWHTSIGMNEWTIAHGFKKRLSLDYRQIEERITAEGVKEDLEQIYIENAVDLFSLFFMDNESIRYYISGTSTLNTDDNSHIEFMATRLLLRQIGRKQLHDVSFRQQLFRDAFAELLRFRKPVLELVKLPGDGEEAVRESILRAHASMTATLRGRLYRMWGMSEIAEQQYHRAIRLFPGNFIARDLLGALDDNRNEILARMKHDPGDPHLRSDLAYHYFSNGKYEQAREEYEKSIDMLANEYAYSRSALCSIYLKDYDRAIETTRRWHGKVSQPVTSDAVRTFREIVYLEREREFRPDDIDLVADLAEHYTRIWDFHSAMELIGEHAKEHPPDLSLLHTLIAIQRYLGDPRITNTSIALLQTHRANMMALDTLTLAQRSIGLPHVSPEFRNLLEFHPGRMFAQETLQIIDNDPTNPYLFFDLKRQKVERDPIESISESQLRAYELFQKASSAWGDGDHGKAVKTFGRGLAVAPERKEIYTSIARICLFTKEYDKGIRAVKKGLEVFGNDRELMALLSKLSFQRALVAGRIKTAEDYWLGARTYMVGGQFEEGLPYLEKALEMDPELEHGLANLGSYFMMTGQLKKAREMYDKALTKTPDDRNLLRLIEALNDKLRPAKEPPSQ